MMNAETLRMIEEAALADDRRYCETVSTLREMAGNGLISYEEVERVETACQPLRNKAAQISKAAHKALVYARVSTMPRLPGMPAPAALTSAEEQLLEQAWNDYCNI